MELETRGRVAHPCFAGRPRVCPAGHPAVFSRHHFRAFGPRQGRLAPDGASSSRQVIRGRDRHRDGWQHHPAR